MSALSDYAEARVCDYLLRTDAVYVGLFTTDPTDAGTGSEVVDAAYARQRAHTSAPSDGFSPIANGQTSNLNVLNFPAIAGAQVIVTHVGIYDAPTGGNLIVHGALQNPKQLDAADVLSLPAGSVTITFS